LANAQVGEYLSQHCVCAYQKMGTFRLVNGQKQGGNVVTYFALPNQTVLHAIAGPVDAATLLREARWVVESRKMGIARSHGSMGKYKSFWRQAHVERLAAEHGTYVNLRQQAGTFSQGSGTPWSPGRDGRSLNLQGQVHLLLANTSLVKLERISEIVFERILGQKVSTLPVIEN
jgi:hypothetical protein